MAGFTFEPEAMLVLQLLISVKVIFTVTRSSVLIMDTFNIRLTFLAT